MFGVAKFCHDTEVAAKTTKSVARIQLFVQNWQQEQNVKPKWIQP